jgi:hypothetical protein
MYCIQEYLLTKGKESKTMMTFQNLSCLASFSKFLKIRKTFKNARFVGNATNKAKI